MTALTWQHIEEAQRKVDALGIKVLRGKFENIDPSSDAGYEITYDGKKIYIVLNRNTNELVLMAEVGLAEMGIEPWPEPKSDMS